MNNTILFDPKSIQIIQKYCEGFSMDEISWFISDFTSPLLIESTIEKYLSFYFGG